MLHGHATFLCVHLDIIAVENTPTEFTRADNLITEENPAEIVCSFTCVVCSGASLQWMYVSGPLPSGVAIITSPVGRTLTLKITEASTDQTGTYVCSAVENEMVVHSAEAYVTILATARVWIPQRTVKVQAGETGFFQCRTSRNANFYWSFKTVEGALLESAVPRVVSETESQLSVGNVRHIVNTGKYFCNVLFSTGESLRADADLSERGGFSSGQLLTFSALQHYTSVPFRHKIRPGKLACFKNKMSEGGNY